MFSDIAVRILPILSMKRELHIDGDIVSPHQYKPFGKKYDSCYNFVASQSYVISSATGRKYYVRRDSSCSTPSFVYMAFWKKNVKSKVLGPHFHGNQDYVTIKAISRRIEQCLFLKCCSTFYWWMSWWRNIFQYLALE